MKRPKMYGDDWPRVVSAEEVYDVMAGKKKESEGVRLAKKALAEAKKYLEEVGK